ncbi:MAG: acyl-CoA thioesterase [Pseudolabrys sp.]|nr:acyl-CoA thioesterase [Pseudolabrys sp.]
MARETPLTRADFTHFLEISTRWMDNDVYGHINNVIYYSFFDTVVNRYLIDHGALDFRNGKVVGLVVETTCSYFKPVSYPDCITAALSVERLGTSSVTYRVAIFRDDDNDATAQGRFTHVYVERATNKPVPLPDMLKAALAKIAR